MRFEFDIIAQNCQIIYHYFESPQCLYSYFHLILHTWIFMDTLKLQSLFMCLSLLCYISLMQKFKFKYFQNVQVFDQLKSDFYSQNCQLTGSSKFKFSLPVCDCEIKQTIFCLKLTHLFITHQSKHIRDGFYLNKADRIHTGIIKEFKHKTITE